ncbi:MAG: nucleotide exchange factor GrpE [Solirubrobacterales bacterium]
MGPDQAPPPTGPVAGGGPSSSQAAREDLDPAPPVDGAQASPPDDALAESGTDGTQVEDDIDALLAEAQQERDEYLDLAKRTKADFENFRKRMSAEIQAAGTRGKGELILQVVPVLDDLERALQAAGIDPEGDSADGLTHGVLLVFRSLRDTLARNGVEAVDPKGEKFDPQLHEALSTQPADGAEAGTIVEVMQKGYRLGEQLVRPARVVVAE